MKTVETIEFIKLFVFLYGMYIDVHAHLDQYFFTEEQVDQVLKNAKENNVGLIITNGLNKETNRHTLALAKKYPQIKAALGIYPWEAMMDDVKAGYYKEESINFDADEEIEFIKKHKHDILAIGEVGLDRKNEHKTNKQIEIFEKFIELSKEIDKPLMVHSRKAEEEAINLLEKHYAKKVIMHCFSGKKSLWEKIKTNGWYCSIPTNCVKSEHFQQLIAYMPITQLFAETDSPFLSPFKDKRNEPAFVVETYKMIAKIKRMELKEVENALFQNYQQVFL
ncbi:MAG: TatD family hydrolase [Candidatus Woesearchaeota archaeon]|jgi:TatD DNase family protein